MRHAKLYIFTKLLHFLMCANLHIHNLSFTHIIAIPRVVLIYLVRASGSVKLTLCALSRMGRHCSPIFYNRALHQSPMQMLERYFTGVFFTHAGLRLAPRSSCTPQFKSPPVSVLFSTSTILNVAALSRLCAFQELPFRIGSP